MRRRLALALFVGSMLCPPANAAEATPAETAEQTAALKALDADLARLDVLLEKITDVPLKATTKGFIETFKASRDKLRQAFDQTRHDELKFELVAEFQRLNLWLRSPRERPLVVAGAVRVVFELEPAPNDPAEVAAALAAADDEIARLAGQASRLPTGAAREAGTQRLEAIKESRASLGRAFTTPAWKALIAALKAGVAPS